MHYCHIFFILAGWVSRFSECIVCEWFAFVKSSLCFMNKLIYRLFFLSHVGIQFENEGFYPLTLVLWFVRSWKYKNFHTTNKWTSDKLVDLGLYIMWGKKYVNPCITLKSICTFTVHHFWFTLAIIFLTYSVELHQKKPQTNEKLVINREKKKERVCVKRESI